MYFTVNTAFINYFDNLMDCKISNFIKPNYIQTDLTDFFTII